MVSPGSMWKVAVGVLAALFVAACSTDDQSIPLASDGSALTRSQQTGVNQHNDDRTRLEGELRGSIIEPRASGRARWENRPDRTRFEVEVEDLSADGRYSVRVNDVYIVSLMVSGGRGEVDLDSRNGSRIPMMNVGNIVTVLNPEGSIALIGHLRPD